MELGLSERISFCKKWYIRDELCGLTKKKKKKLATVIVGLFSLKENARTKKKEKKLVTVIVGLFSLKEKASTRTGISNIMFALRSEKSPDGKSGFEKQNGRKPNTENSRMTEKSILEQDPQIEIAPEDFSEEADSTILVRERVRGTELEGAFKTVKGKIVGESSHTITVLPKAGQQVVYSKRDVASGGYQATSSKPQSPSKKSKQVKCQKAKERQARRKR